MAGFVGTFQRAIANALVAFLQDKNVQRLVQSFGLVEDDAAESLAQGVRLSQPLRADTSALPYLSGDRGITLYTTEGDVSQRDRLAHWWQLHRMRGTHQGEMRYAHPFFNDQFGGLPKMRIVHQAGDGSSATWHTLDAADVYTVQRHAPSNWNWDGVTSAWSRFWVIIYVDTIAFPASSKWDGVWPNTPYWDNASDIWDSLLTYDQVQTVRHAIEEWKSAHSTLWGIILATDPTSFNPTSNPTISMDGWSSLPVGNWYSTIDPVTGKLSRLPTCAVAYNLGKA